MNAHNFLNKEPHLVCIESGIIYPLADICTTIGRSKENDIVLLKDLSLSRRHAVITKVEGKYYLRDLRSSNGTLVNGLLVDGMQVLSPDDEVFLGRTRMFFSPSESRLAAARSFGSAKKVPTPSLLMPLQSTLAKIKSAVQLALASSATENEETVPSLKDSLTRLKQIHKNEILKVLQR